MTGIDIHTHAFHPKIAHKVVDQLDGHYQIHPVGNGLIDDLLSRVRSAGLARAVVLCAATSGGQVIPANNFSIQLQQNNPEVIAFGTLHPDFEDWEKELDRLRQAGIFGLKLHPEFQGFWLDDPRLLPIIEAAQNDFAFLVHVGDRLPPKQNPSCPYKMAAIIKQFPNAKMIAAHLGGFMHWKFALEALAGTNVYFDTSSSLEFIPDQLLHEIFARHPRERILFGSDYPLYDPAEEMDLLKTRMKLSDDALEEIICNGELFLEPFGLEKV